MRSNSPFTRDHFVKLVWRAKQNPAPIPPSFQVRASQESRAICHLRTGIGQGNETLKVACLKPFPVQPGTEPQSALLASAAKLHSTALVSRKVSQILDKEVSCIADGRLPASEADVLPKISCMLRTPAFAQPSQPTRLLTRDLTARLRPRIRSLSTTSFSGNGTGNGSNSRETGHSTCWTDSARRTPTTLLARFGHFFLPPAGGAPVRSSRSFRHSLAAAVSFASTLEANSFSSGAIEHL